MLKIDNSLLEEIGLSSLPDVEKNSFLKHVYETLEMRVGVRLADQMTNQQLDEFEKYFEAKDDAGAFKWLETNFPNYKDIVQEEFDKLKAEVAQTAPQILAASQTAQAQAGQNPTPVAAAASVPPAPIDPSAQIPQSQPFALPAQPAAVPQQPFQTVPSAPTPLSPDPIPAPQPQPVPPAEPFQPPLPPQPPQPQFPPQQPPAGPPAQ